MQARGPPSPPCSPSLLARGRRLRAEAAETRGGARRRPAGCVWVARSRDARRLTWRRRAHLHGRGFVLGNRFPGCPGRASGSPPLLPAARGHWRVTVSGPWAGSVEEPRPRLLSHLETVPCSAGMDPRRVRGAGHRARGARTAAASSSSAGRWRPGHSSEAWGSVSSLRGRIPQENAAARK